MKIKAKAFGKYYVTIIDVYDDMGEAWAICISENGKIEQRRCDALEIIDEEYLPKGADNDRKRAE